MKRRNAWLAGVAMIAPLATALANPVPTSTVATGELRIDGREMILTRIVQRPLTGGATVETRRSYRIRFVGDALGYRVEGTLIDVEVDAPPGLAALAELERRRPDAGLFPFYMDRAGMLLPAQPAPRAAEVDEGVSLVTHRIERSDLTGEAKRQAKAFVDQIDRQSGRTPWPQNLFRPSAGISRHTQTMPLPNGAQGEVTVEIEGRTQSESGLLESLSRTVTTKLGGSVSTTREIWTLAPAE